MTQVANLRYRKDGAYGPVGVIRPEQVVFIRPGLVSRTGCANERPFVLSVFALRKSESVRPEPVEG